MKRRFLSLDAHPSLYLILAAIFGAVLVIGEQVVIPARKYDTDNLIAAGILVLLVAVFLWLAERSYRRRRRNRLE